MPTSTLSLFEQSFGPFLNLSLSRALILLFSFDHLLIITYVATMHASAIASTRATWAHHTSLQL